MFVIFLLVVNIRQKKLILKFKNNTNVVKGNRLSILHKTVNIYDEINNLITLTYERLLK